MQRRASVIASSVIFATGVALGLAALADDSNSPEQNIASSTPLLRGRMATETRADSRTAMPRPNTSEIDAGIGSVSSAPATRSSFMASWKGVTGANGYLLDVSTSDSFSTYVGGYHDLDVGNVTGRVVTGLDPGTTYYYRVRAYGAAGPGSYSEATMGATVPTTGLIIQSTFDSTITSQPNAAAIEATINQAISIYESLFMDPITIQIRFRYAIALPDGTPLTGMSESLTVIYATGWDIWMSVLRADATSSNDNIAIASLPANALSTSVIAASANGRALGLNTPPAMFADGTVGTGGPYDGIVTLNSAKPFQFDRPTSANNFDAQRTIEQEIAKNMGLLYDASNFTPDDLFSWASPGQRNTTTAGTRYFSIDGGVTNIINFNQNPNGDFAGWQSDACPQAHPYVQNAIPCMGQFSDIGATSPEGINLDVIGYNLVNGPIVATDAATNVASFSATLNGTVNPNGLTTAVHFDYGSTNNYGSSTATQNYNGSTAQDVVANVSSLRTGATYHFRIVASNAAGTTYGADRTFTTSVARAVVADFNGDGTPDLVVQRMSTHQTVVLYLNNNVVIGAAVGPTLPAGWRLAGAADFNGDGHPDYALFNSATGQTVIVYLSGVTVVGAAVGPSLSPGWELVGAADFNGDGHPDYVLYKASTHETAIWYLNNNVFISATSGPTLPSGWNLAAVADFNGDGHPDYALFNSVTGQTVIGYLSGGTIIGAAFGPTVPGAWPLVATADFNQDGHPDYLLYNPVSRQTALGYLNNNVLINAALGPTLPGGWTLVAP